MENVKEHWLVYGASVYPGRDGECVMAYNSADGQRGVRARAPVGGKTQYPVRRQLLAPGRCMVYRSV